MKSKKLVSAILAAASIAGGVVGAQAATIDDLAAKVQEQLDAQDNKNKVQDESIKANGAAINANKDAIKANADAIKANKEDADAKIHILTAVSKTIPLTSIRTKLLSKTKQKIAKMQTRS